MGSLGSTTATLLLLAFLVPTVAVFVISYRHALATWLTRPGAAALPVATVVRPGAGPGPARAPVSVAQRVHATIIATAFASVFTMMLIALAVIVTVIAAA